MHCGCVGAVKVGTRYFGARAPFVLAPVAVLYATGRKPA
jgi:hypothetical protein